MRKVRALLMTLFCVVAGCAQWEAPLTPQRRPVTSAPASAPAEMSGARVPIGPADAPWMILTSAVDADHGADYRFHEQSPETQRYSLRPTSAPAPVLSVEVRELADGTAALSLGGEGAIPRLWLRGESASGAQPIRLHPDDSLLAAVGPVSGGFDGLVLPGGRLLQVDGRVHAQSGPGLLALSIEVPADTAQAFAIKPLGPLSTQTAPAPSPVPASAPDPLAEPAPEPPVWQQLEPWLVSLLSGEPAQTPVPGVIARLSPEQAKLVAGAAALRGVDLSKRLDDGSSEQVARAMRATSQPADVRLLDRLPRPPATAINLVVGGEHSYQAVGLFNLGARWQTREIEPERFLIEGPSVPVGIWDPWSRQLLRVDAHAAWNRDRTAPAHVRLSLAPRSSRLFQLASLQGDRPTVLPPSGSLVQPRHSTWDAAQLMLSGQLEVAAFEPLELAIYLPYGEASFELADARAEPALVHARIQGPLRILTLEADRAGPVSWRATFHRAAQTLPPAPPTPVKPVAQQNTRGVLLSWPVVPAAVLYRVLRDGRPLAEVEGASWQDSTCVYNRGYTYTAQAVDVFGRASATSAGLDYRTPAPASTNLTQLVPLWSDQDRFEPGIDVNAAGGPLRVGGQRFYRGLGTHANSTIRYYLGGGYHEFSGAVGIDEAAGRTGSAIFEVWADGSVLWSAGPLRGGQPATPFSVNVSGKGELELITRDAGDGITGDYADWANVYLRVAR